MVTSNTGPFPVALVMAVKVESSRVRDLYFAAAMSEGVIPSVAVREIFSKDEPVAVTSEALASGVRDTSAMEKLTALAASFATVTESSLKLPPVTVQRAKPYAVGPGRVIAQDIIVKPSADVMTVVIGVSALSLVVCIPVPRDNSTPLIVAAAVEKG